MHKMKSEFEADLLQEGDNIELVIDKLLLSCAKGAFEVLELPGEPGTFYLVIRDVSKEMGLE